MPRVSAWRVVRLVSLVVIVGMLAGTRPALSATGTISVDASTAVGTSLTRLSTQVVYPGIIEDAGAQGALNSYAPPLMRIHAGTDGCCWAGGPGPALPEGVTQGSWDFAPLTQMIGNIHAYGGSPVLNIRYAPNWMWTCSAFSGAAGSVRDQTFNQFGDYVARLVSYYNLGHMTTEAGTTITNPAGTANRIGYWELWNEPDLSNEDPCHPADWGPALSGAQYLTMWNATVPKMLAVDPSVKVVGPTLATELAATSYVPQLMAGAAHPPDVVSYHAYGGWDNSQSDSFLFDGDGSCPECGIRGMVGELAEIKAMAQGRPIWVTEMNVNAAYGDDGAHRPWTAYGAAWGASAFRMFVLGGASLIHQYQFVESMQFGLVNPNTGAPLLPYWRDYYLSRMFPAGSTILSASSTLSGIEVLAARAPGSTNVRVLVVNRQVPNTTVVGAAGLSGTAQVSVAGLGTVSSVTMRMLDNSTPLASGPALVALPAGNTATVNFPGYGAAILEFSTSGGPTPTPTPAPTPTPTPSNTPLPTPNGSPPVLPPGPGPTPPPTTPPVIPPPTTAIFGSQWVDQSAYPVLAPGAIGRVTLRFRNTGTTPWIRGVAGMQANLGIPGDDTSFDALGMNAGWLSANRLATTDEPVVAPGSIGTFNFAVRAPLTASRYSVPLRPVIDGTTWLTDQGVYIQVTSDYGYHSAWVTQSAYPDLQPGAASGVLSVTFRNVGTRPWVRGTGAQLNLGINGDDRQWASLAIDWPSEDRVAIQTETVVPSGSTATFAFRVRAPLTPGVYYLNLRPVIDGVTWLEDEGVWLQLTVE